jgi:hypothetical protein
MTIDCPLCGRSLFFQLVPKEFLHEQRLVKCAGCGLVRLIGKGSSHLDYWDDNTVALDVYSNSKVRTQLSYRYGRYLQIITSFWVDERAFSWMLDAGSGTF